VRIQNVFSQTISENTLTVNPAGIWVETDGVCEVWVSENHIKEGEIIAHSIQQWMEEDKLSPKDFCIIVKQQEHIYSKAIVESLDKLEINSRRSEERRVGKEGIAGRWREKNRRTQQEKEDE